MKKVYLSHPYGGKEENREAAAVHWYVKHHITTRRWAA